MWSVRWRTRTPWWRFCPLTTCAGALWWRSCTAFRVWGLLPFVRATRRGRSAAQNPSSRRWHTSSPFWMTCTPLLMCQTVHVHCMTVWEQSCTHKRGFAFTRGRAECGTERHYVLQGLSTGSVEPRRREKIGNVFGFTEVHSGGCRETIGRSGTQSQWCRISVADPLAVRRPEVPPHVANIATITVRSARLRTWFGDGAGDTHTVGTPRRLPASTLKPEEREFVVDSGASMHMTSKKDLSDAEMDTLTKSCSPTIVRTANGEVQTHEEATVYVRESEKFLTMKVLENTPAVLSLGKLCDENRYSYAWISGQKPHVILNGIRIQCNTENFVPIVVPGLSANSSSGSDSSTSRTLSRQGSHYSTYFSSSSSSPSVDDPKTRERGDQIESDTSPVTVSTTVDERSGSQ